MGEASSRGLLWTGWPEHLSPFWNGTRSNLWMSSVSLGEVTRPVKVKVRPRWWSAVALSVVLCLAGFLAGDGPASEG
jgi:hypothetical protein